MENEKIIIPKKENCENCTHFFKSKTYKDKAFCTHPDMNNRLKKIKRFYVCDYFEAADLEEDYILINK